MGLVDDHAAVAREVGLGQKLAKEHAVGHVLDDRLVAGAVFESDRVPDLVAQAAADLLGDTRGDGHGRDAARLGAPDLEAVLRVTGLVKVLRELRRLARAGFTLDDEDLILRHGLEELFAPLKHG